MLFIQQLC